MISFLFGFSSSSKTLTLDEFTDRCYRQPQDALTLIKAHPTLAKQAPFELLLALCKTKTSLFESYDQRPSPSTEEVAIALIEAGANIHGREKITGYTLLHHALENGLDQLALKLLECGHDPKAKLFSGVTPLHLAAQDGFRFRNVIARLVQDNTTLAEVTADGSTALHFAARARNIEGVHLLLKAGIDPAKKNRFYQTALAVASLFQENKEVIARLKAPEEKGTEVFIESCPHRPLELLYRDNYARAIFQLQQGDTLTDDDACKVWAHLGATIHRILTDNPEVIKQFSDRLPVQLLKQKGEATHYLIRQLMSFGVGIHGKDPETGCQAIHLAVEQGCFFLVKALLEADADPNAKDAEGNTPLHYSAHKERDKILELLLNAGANPMVQNKKAQLPLQVAKKGRTSRWRQIFEQYAADKANPLQAVLLLDLPAGPVLAYMTEEQKMSGIKQLLAKYPESLSLILRKFFETNIHHIQTDAVLTTQPPALPPQDLTKLSAHAESEEISAKVLEFLKNVEKQTPFIGTPQADSTALQDFYRNIRHSLGHLVIKDLDDSARATICRKIAKASSECGTTYLATALDLYNNYCLNITPSLPTAFFEQLQVLRGVLVESMLLETYVNKHQSVHALHHFKRTLGEPLKLADRVVFSNEDPLESNGFIDWQIPAYETLWQSFTNRYTAGCISDWLIELMHDHRYRKFYINWAKEHLQDETPFIGETFTPNPIAIVKMLCKLHIIQFKS